MSQDAQDTNKLSRVTDEMLQTFSDKKEEEPEEVVEEIPEEEFSVIDPTTEEETDKTVVEFDEDEAISDPESKPINPKRSGSFLKWLLIILLIAFVGTAIFGI